MKRYINAILGITLLVGVAAAAETPKLNTELPGIYSGEQKSAQKLAGAVVLEGKKLPVNITFGGFMSDSKIIIGPLVFAISGEGASFSGYRKADGADQNIEIMPAGADILKNPQQAAKEFGISNYKEIKCSQGDYFLMLSDNITNKIVANCVKLL